MPVQVFTQYEVETLFNLAPTALVPIVIREDGQPKVVTAVWWLLLKRGKDGLVPNPQWKTFNAVSSRAGKSKLYAPALKRSRCIVVGSNYYEFVAEGKQKQGYAIVPASDVIAFAGLYRKWQYGEHVIYSCSMMTTDGHPKLAHIHEKSFPVMLAEPDYESWLSNEELHTGQLEIIFESRLREPFNVYPVDQSVNKAATKGDICIKPIGDIERIAAD